MQGSEKRLVREALGIRILWMLLFLVVWQVVVPVLGILIVLQTLYRVVKGKLNAELLSWCDSLSQYLAQIAYFASFKTEEKPWPMADWPTSTSNNQSEQAKEGL